MEININQALIIIGQQTIQIHLLEDALETRSQQLEEAGTRNEKLEHEVDRLTHLLEFGPEVRGFGPYPEGAENEHDRDLVD